MSLRPGGQSAAIPAATFAAQHQCGFWNAQAAQALAWHGLDDLSLGTSAMSCAV